MSLFLSVSLRYEKGKSDKMNMYLKEKEEVLQAVESSVDGLNQQTVLERQKEGKNQLKGEKKVPLWKRFLKELSDPMVLVLIVAAFISGITAFYAHESYADVIIILIVVLINAVLGVYQESKAEKAIEALAKMASAQSKVLRDGQMQIIKSEDIVVGDIVLLEAGDAIPADGRLLEAASLKVEESALTGESVPVDKVERALVLKDERDIVLGDRKNMIYMGSNVAYGRGKAVITAIGMDTEMGKIADALTKAKDDETPLQVKLNQLSKILSVLVLGICAVIFGVDVWRSYPDITMQGMLDTFMVAVSLAVAAIPEGLAAVVTIVLSLGVTKMSKKKAIIRKLTAVETLGCTRVICSDKTGTLTQNKMTVVKVESEDPTLLTQLMALCSDAEVNEEGETVGEPTEAALVAYAFKQGMPKNHLKKVYPRIQEAPFDSLRKMMTTIHQDQEGHLYQYTKGAPDEVLKRCQYALVDGKQVVLDDQLRKKFLEQNKAMADGALRVLCGAYRLLDHLPESVDPERLEQDLCYVGLMGMIDPVREEVKDAIEQCHQAGIRVVMITGDHRDTAVAIAKQLHLIEDESQAMTGSQLNEKSDEWLKENITQYAVYARVQPEHKVRIVQAWKANEAITAMTGDGVNDAPSIKNADIGVGMGITGTDVTKNVADMVLADDNFATIVSAVEEGRRIYDNIRKSIQFLLSSNLAEVLSIFLATLGGFVVLKPVHLLWINLITDCFPALALGMEESEADVMARQPRDPKEGIFADGLGIDVFVQGALITCITMISYFVGHYIESGRFEIVTSLDGMTMAFLTLSMVEIFHSFNMRSRNASIFSMTSHNRYLWLAMIVSLLCTTAVIYVPFLSQAFGFEHISIIEYIIAMLLALTIIPMMEVIKYFKRKK